MQPGSPRCPRRASPPLPDIARCRRWPAWPSHRRGGFGWPGRPRVPPGVITPISGTAKLRCSSGSAAAVAELQATTISLTPEAARYEAISWANRRIVTAGFVPYGKRPSAESPKYTKSSCGSVTRHSCNTVRPPTPESNTPIGRESIRGSVGARPDTGDRLTCHDRTDPSQRPFWKSRAELCLDLTRRAATGVPGARRRRHERVGGRGRRPQLRAGDRRSRPARSASTSGPTTTATWCICRTPAETRTGTST